MCHPGLHPPLHLSLWFVKPSNGSQCLNPSTVGFACNEITPCNVFFVSELDLIGERDRDDHVYL